MIPDASKGRNSQQGIATDLDIHAINAKERKERETLAREQKPSAGG
jgi:hypothetical protein